MDWKRVATGDNFFSPERHICITRRLLLTTHFLLLPAHNLLPSPRNLKPQSLSLAQNGINLNCVAARESYYLYVAPVHTDVIKIVFPPPVNLLYVHLVLRPATEPRRVEVKFFPSLEEHDFF